MSNQAFVDVIISRKRAPSHRVFVAQVFGRNMCGKQRRRHHFSAFWLIGKLPFLDCDQSLVIGKVVPAADVFWCYPVQLSWCLVGPALVFLWSCLGRALALVLPWSWSCLGLGLALVLLWSWFCLGPGPALVVCSLLPLLIWLWCL